MTTILRWRLLVALLLAPVLTASAQPTQQATIDGTVIDGQTGTPLTGVHVFIAASMNGTTTDEEGRYRLNNVPLGAHRLYVSSLGYEPIPKDVFLNEAKSYTFDFGMEATVIELDEVTVTGERDKKWLSRLERFTMLFIGETPNAQETKMINPEVLDFESKRSRFYAQASDILVIENHALGYRIQYFLKDFEATTTHTRYDGEPLFEEMEPESPEQRAAWDTARREAWNGSFRHFILAVLDKKVEQEGFMVYSRPGVKSKVSGSPFQRMAMQNTQRSPLDPYDIIKAGEQAEENILDFEGFVEIIYTREEEDEAYLAWRQSPMGQRPKFRTSMISLEQGPTIIDNKGDVLDPYGVTFYGYLAFERVADELPKEYRPWH